MPAICAVRKINLISNELKYYTRNAIVNVSQFFSTGIMMQGFLSSKGVSNVNDLTLINISDPKRPN